MKQLRAEKPALQPIDNNSDLSSVFIGQSRFGLTP